jgi:ssDNA-binding Zn-finger/Zn-ribbon topoisomerase 1
LLRLLRDWRLRRNKHDESRWVDAVEAGGDPADASRRYDVFEDPCPADLAFAALAPRMCEFVEAAAIMGRAQTHDDGCGCFCCRAKTLLDEILATWPAEAPEAWRPFAGACRRCGKGNLVARSFFGSGSREARCPDCGVRWSPDAPPDTDWRPAPFTPCPVCGVLEVSRRPQGNTDYEHWRCAACSHSWSVHPDPVRKLSDAWSPAENFPCKKCGVEAVVYTDVGDLADTRYRCTACGHTWCVDGIDS